MTPTFELSNTLDDLCSSLNDAISQMMKAINEIANSMITVINDILESCINTSNYYIPSDAINNIDTKKPAPKTKPIIIAIPDYFTLSLANIHIQIKVDHIIAIILFLLSFLPWEKTKDFFIIVVNYLIKLI